MTQNSKKSLQSRTFFQYFATLSSTEVSAFSNFCASFSLAAPAKKLLVYATDAYPNFATLVKNKAFVQSFLQDAKTKKQLNYALHDLLTLLQKWLMIDELERDAALKNQLLIRACKRRFLHQQFSKKSIAALTALEHDFAPVPTTWLHKFTINYHLFAHVRTNQNEYEANSLTDIDHNLDLFYYGAKIRQLCQNIYRQKVSANLPNLALAEEKSILDFAKTTGRAIPFFFLHTQLIEYLKHPNLLAMETFVEQYKSYRHTLDRLDQMRLLAIAINSLNGVTMTGDIAATQLQFDLFQLAFAHDLVLSDNVMKVGFFNNFILVACMLEEFKFAQRMLKKYAPHFEADTREEFTNLVQCTIYYYQKKYEKVDLSLYNSKFKHPGLRIRSRNLLLKSLYECYQKNPKLKLKNTILAELINLRKYIQKQRQMTVARKEYYYQMIIVIRKLTHALDARPNKRIRLKTELTELLSQQPQRIMSKKWLSEKVEEL